MLFLGVLLIVVGVQLLTLGRIGQLLVLLRRERDGPRSDQAQISRRVGGAGGPR